MKNQSLRSFFSVWQKLTLTSINRQIFAAVFTVAAFTALVKLTAIGKELLVAWQFGTEDELDAFLIALVIPALVVNVVAGSLNAAFMPTYIRVREQEGLKAAQKLFASTTICSLGLLLLTSLVMVIGAPWYLRAIASGFTPEKLNLTCHLLWSIAPIVLLSGINTIWGAILNAGEKFILVAVAPIMTPVLTISLLLAVPNGNIYTLVGGLVGGTALETVLLGIGLSRQKLCLRPRWYGYNTHLRQVIRQYAPTIAGALLICSAIPVDQSMAAMLSPGSVAALNYSNRLIASPISLIATALGTAIIPYFAKMIAQQDWRRVDATLTRYLQAIFVTTLPLTIIMVFFSEPIVRLLLERGSFTSADTTIVAQIQAFYALQIPFYIANILVVKLINALEKNQILFQVSAWNLAINISLNYLFITWFGIQGIALSTSCVYLFSFIYTFTFVRKQLSKKIIN
ncbi:MAG: murein biosynthesis integral membrane protein MurJ [Xenococcaceae cyanobacterium]